MRFCLNPINSISENFKQQINSKNVFLYLPLLYFKYFEEYHISVLTDFIITMESRKVILENRINFTLYFSFLAPKGFKIDNDFEHFNYLSAVKLFLSNMSARIYIRTYFNLNFPQFEDLCFSHGDQNYRQRESLRLRFLQYIIFFTFVILLYFTLLRNCTSCKKIIMN